MNKQELASAWCDYWVAFREGADQKMADIYNKRIAPLERIANHRKSTMKMLAQLLP